MNILRTLFRRITSTRYTRSLEAEVLRLHAENRALLNSIQEGAPRSMVSRAWGTDIAGVPPIPTRSPAATTLPGPHAPPHTGLDAPASGPVPPPRSPASRAAAVGETLGNGGVRTIAPLRRRSWHQITRMLEFESARKREHERTVPGD
ncbi:MAG: hypothetical protein ABSE45_10300 [Candidatus Acidiferrales bacterium]|jgi:hypothetical protein